jgi:hypothetical protein
MAYVGTYLALTAGLFVLFYLTGHAAARRLLPAPWSLAFEERLALRLVAGMAVWVALLFALAALQLLRPWAIWSAIGLTLAAGIWSAARTPGKLARAGPPPAPIAPAAWRDLRDPLAMLLAAVLALVVAALWAQALRPIVAWDADVYHLTVPRLNLEHGGFRRIPYNVYSNWPLAVQMLFGLALTVKDHILATGIHFGLGVLLAIVAGAAAARGAAPLWGLIAAALLLAHPVFLFEIRIAYVDVACAFFLFAGFLALHRALADPADENRWLLAAGLACGLLAGSKINGIFGAAAIAAVYAGSRLRRGARIRSLARPLLVFAVPVATLWLPWLVKSWWLTGNPLYPLLYGVFGGPEWSVALGRAHREWSLAIAMGDSARDFLLHRRQLFRSVADRGAAPRAGGPRGDPPRPRRARHHARAGGAKAGRTGLSTGLPRAARGSVDARGVSLAGRHVHAPGAGRGPGLIVLRAAMKSAISRHTSGRASRSLCPAPGTSRTRARSRSATRWPWAAGIKSSWAPWMTSAGARTRSLAASES